MKQPDRVAEAFVSTRVAALGLRFENTFKTTTLHFDLFIFKGPPEPDCLTAALCRETGDSRRDVAHCVTMAAVVASLRSAKLH